MRSEKLGLLRTALRARALRTYPTLLAELDRKGRLRAALGRRHPSTPPVGLRESCALARKGWRGGRAGGMQPYGDKIPIGVPSLG